MSRVMRLNRLSCCGLALLGWGLLTCPSLVADDSNAVRVDRAFGPNQQGMFVEDEFIVVLTADARQNATAGADQFGPTVSLPSLQDVVDRQGVTRLARQFPTAQVQPAGGRFHDLTGYYKAKVGPGVNLDAAMAAFARNPNVDHVEKIGIHPVYSCATGTPQTPNDTYYDNPPPTFNWPQWDLWDTNGIDADLAWNDQAGDETVVVVAMDSGVRYYHKDLGGNDPPGPADNVTDGNIWVNPFEIPNNGIDDEGNGKVDDVVGWDFVTGVTGCSSGEDCSTQDNDPRDFNGHGTHTAGTMAAITNNARSVAGIAGGFGDGTTGSAGNGSKIMCMRIGWATPIGGYVRMDFAAQAMNYVTDMKNRGVNVAAVNASWGSSNSGGIDAAVDNLLAADVMLIHAAGNGNADAPGYLGNKAGVMNVAATDKNGNRASFSNYGSWVDIAAPGVDIISTYHVSSDPANDYVAVMDGTSMSAPHVAGVAALLESCDSSLSGPDKFSIMVNNGCVAGSPNIGDILNARLALDAVPGGCGGGVCPDGTCDPGEDQCNCPADCGTPPGSETGLCTDGVDNDCDGPSDCADSDCAGDPACQCGDGTCDPGEDCSNCPADCISSGGGCGDGICAGSGEDCFSCPGDCRCAGGGCVHCCGDGACTGSEKPNNCPVDCDPGFQPPQGYCCGDSTCEGAEDECNCAVDCPGTCPTCGDATCDPGEDQCNCAADCGTPPANETPGVDCNDGIDNDCDGGADCNDTDNDCDTDPACICGQRGDPCAVGADCCSGNCKRNGTCR